VFVSKQFSAFTEDNGVVAHSMHPCCVYKKYTLNGWVASAIGSVQNYVISCPQDSVSSWSYILCVGCAHLVQVYALLEYIQMLYYVCI